MVGVMYRYGCLIWIAGAFALSPVSSFADESQLGFDVPTIVVAEQVEVAALGNPHQQGRYVRLQIPVSSFVSPSFRGEVAEYVVRIESASHAFQVADFWPRQEQVTQVAGNVRVEQAEKRNVEAGGNVKSGLQPFVSGGIEGSYQTEKTLKESFEKKPTLHTVSLAGLANRGAGAFFKFRAGPNSTLEGARDLALLVSVPRSWRGDVLRVTMQAYGRRTSYDQSTRQIFQQRYWVAVYQEGDRFAASRARQFVRQEQALRATAASTQAQVERAAKPTVFHQIGAALEVMKPRIPDDYLSQVIFGPKSQYLEGHSHRLPLDLRIAILDFWEQRDAMLELAYEPAPQASTELLTANQM
ncbi:MAG: hypothetical protein AAGG44_00095 [Planctomycetota bacterium]